jgi:uncharacterized MAPEG superfamily protein
MLRQSRRPPVSPARTTGMGFAVLVIAAAALLPFGLLLASAWPSSATPSRWGPDWDNHDVRGSMDRLRGWRRRAHFAQINGHEAFAPFAAAMILTQLSHAPSGWVHPLALAFLLLRVLHGIAYVADRPFLRSTSWCCAWLTVLGLFGSALGSVV